MKLNETGDAISEWLKHILTPEKMEAVKQSIEHYISTNISRVAQHKLDLYLGYLGLTKDNIAHHINSSMPAFWNETTGKALEQLIKVLGG